MRLLTIAALSLPLCVAPAPPAPPKLEVHFSPGGGCTAAVVREIGLAKHSVRVLAYSFTSVAISDALIAARTRGVDVAAVVDASNATDPHSRAKPLAAACVPVAFDYKHAIMHDKTTVVDSKVVLTGSLNYTDAAEHANAENMLIVRDAPLAVLYAAEWQRHRDHSGPPKAEAGGD